MGDSKNAPSANPLAKKSVCYRKTNIEVRLGDRVHAGRFGEGTVCYVPGVSPSDPRIKRYRWLIGVGSDRVVGFSRNPVLWEKAGPPKWVRFIRRAEPSDPDPATLLPPLPHSLLYYRRSGEEVQPGDHVLFRAFHRCYRLTKTTITHVPALSPYSAIFDAPDMWCIAYDAGEGYVYVGWYEAGSMLGERFLSRGEPPARKPDDPKAEYPPRYRPRSYHGTATEILLGDRLRIKYRGQWREATVCYVPGISPIDPRLEDERRSDWIARADDGDLIRVAHVDFGEEYSEEPGSKPPPKPINRPTALIRRAEPSDPDPTALLPPLPHSLMYYPDGSDVRIGDRVTIRGVCLRRWTREAKICSLPGVSRGNPDPDPDRGRFYAFKTPDGKVHTGFYDPGRILRRFTLLSRGRGSGRAKKEKKESQE